MLFLTISESNFDDYLLKILFLAFCIDTSKSLLMICNASFELFVDYKVTLRVKLRIEIVWRIVNGVLSAENKIS
jgi:hypothetical protein